MIVSIALNDQDGRTATTFAGRTSLLGTLN